MSKISTEEYGIWKDFTAVIPKENMVCVVSLTYPSGNKERYLAAYLDEEFFTISNNAPLNEEYITAWYGVPNEGE